MNVHEHVTCHNVACHWMINTALTDVDARHVRLRPSTDVDALGVNAQAF